MRQEILELFPKLQEITDRTLQETVIDVWEAAIRVSDMELEDLRSRTVPFTLLVPALMSNGRARITLVEHTNEVTDAAILLAESLNRSGADLNRDHVIAAANLHDVGKLIEYHFSEGQVAQNERGRKLRHPFLGAAVAFGYDLPVDVIQTIFGHSKELADEKRTLLCKVVNRADFFLFHPIKDFLSEF